jgi:plasmid stabilization system protein ParE
MEPSVRLTEQAYEEIDGIVAYIAQDAPVAALRWRDSLLKKIDSLRHFPLRHGLAPEAQAVGIDVRQTIHGVYRIFYTVDGDIVTVHGVRHGARRPLRPDELPGQS